MHFIAAKAHHLRESGADGDKSADRGPVRRWRGSFDLISSLSFTEGRIAKDPMQTVAITRSETGALILKGLNRGNGFSAHAKDPCMLRRNIIRPE